MEFFSNMLTQAVGYLKSIADALASQNRFDLTRQQLAQRVTITLAAGEVREFSTAFRSITIVSMTGATTGVFMRFKQGAGQSQNEIFAGLRLWTPRPEIFVESATFENTTAAPVTINFILGFMDSEDTRLNLTGSIVTRAGGTTTYTRGSATTSPASIAASASRNAILIQHLGTSGVLHIGDAAVTTATSAVQLQAGQSYSAENGGLVGYTADTGTIAIGIVEYLT